MLKAQRQNKKRYAFNVILKKRLKTQYKKFSKTALADKEKAREMIPVLQQAFAKAAKKGIMNKNKMNRKISAIYRIVKKAL